MKAVKIPAGDLSQAWRETQLEVEIRHDLPLRSGTYEISLHLPEPLQAEERDTKFEGKLAGRFSN